VLTATANPLPATMNAPLADRYLTVDGARLRYRDQGSGPAVLLLHGWTLDLDMWDALAAALRASFRVLRLDRRGFGLSSGAASPERDISDLDALLRHLGIEQAALLGMSQGARAAIGFAAIAARRISCLMLDGPPDLARGADAGANAGEDDLPLAHYRALVRSRGMDAFRAEWSAHPLMQLHTDDRDARRLLQTIIRRYPGGDLSVNTSGASPHAEVLAESITVPALVITGAHDLTPRIRAADLLAQRLPAAERAVVADAGHLPNLDNPLVYNNLVWGFLNRHADRKPQ
jgi:pimeloyl-ACP methyl ester carboxylesterase